MNAELTEAIKPNPVLARQWRYKPGDVIGAWTLIESVKGNRRALWRVRCKCGTERIKLPSAARQRSSGCSKCPRPRYRPGQKIGDWTLVKFLGLGIWQVRCVCGFEREKTPHCARAHGCAQCAKTYHYWTSKKHEALAFPPLDPNRTKFSDITATVSEFYGVPEKRLHGPRRFRTIAIPRMMVYALARDLTRLSTTDIGKKLGGRDHGTVIHGTRRIAQLRAVNPDLDDAYTALKARLSYRPEAEAAE